jgi:WD40 repeat protein
MDLNKAEALFSSGDAMVGVAYLGRVLRHSPSNRVAVARLMDTLCRRSLPLPIAAIQLDAPSRLMAFTQDGRRLVTVSADNVARIWDPLSGEALSPPMKHDQEVHAAIFTRDAGRLVTLLGKPGKEAGVQVWDTRTGQRISSIRPPSGLAGSTRHFNDGRQEFDFAKLVISPDGQRIFLTSSAYHLQAWSANTGNIIPDFHPFQGAEPLAVSSDGRLLLAQGLPVILDGSRVRTNAFVFDAATGELRYTFLQHRGRFGDNPAPMFSADGRYVFDFRYLETSLRVRSAETGAPLTEPLQPSSFGLPRDEDPFRLRSLSPSKSDSIKVSDRKGSTSIAEFRIDGLNLFRLDDRAVLSPDGLILAIHWKGNVVDIYDARFGGAHYQGFLEGGSEWDRVRWPIEMKLLITRT